MKHFYLLFILCFFLSGSILFGGEIHKTFEAKSTLEVKTISGDCIVKKGGSSEIKVDVVYSVSPEDAFEPVFRETSSTLKIQEKWHRNSSGRVTWTLTVPQETEIEYSTASGDLLVSGSFKNIDAETASGEVTIEDSEGEFECSTASGEITLRNVKGELEFSTASGEIEARKIDGEIEMSTASGDIDIKMAKGSFELSTASGEIEASEIMIEEESFFSAASGDIELELAKSAEYDLDLSAASGDIILNYNGNPFKGYFELTTKKSSGRISCPVKFEREDEFERNGRTYLKKSFRAGGDKPKIIMQTASGDISLEK